MERCAAGAVMMPELPSAARGRGASGGDESRMVLCGHFWRRNAAAFRQMGEKRMNGSGPMGRALGRLEHPRTELVRECERKCALCCRRAER